MRALIDPLHSWMWHQTRQILPLSITCLTLTFMLISIALAQDESPKRREATRLMKAAKMHYETSAGAMFVDRLRSALDDANKAILVDPSFEMSYFIRARIYSEMQAMDGVLKNGELALRDYDKAISLKSDFALAYYGRGYVRLVIANSVKDTKGLMDGLMAGVDEKESVKSTDLRGNTGSQLIDMAIADLTHAVRQRKSYFIYFGRAEAYRMKGDYVHASDDYRESLRLEPSFQEAKDRLAVLATSSLISQIVGEWDATNTNGDTKVAFRMRFDNRGGLPTGIILLSTGDQKRLEILHIKANRSYTFRVDLVDALQPNNARVTLNTVGTFSNDLRTMFGTTRTKSWTMSSGQIINGTFVATKRS